MPPVPSGTKAIDLTYAVARIVDKARGSDFAELLSRRFGPGKPIAPTSETVDQIEGPRQFQYPVAVNTNFATPRREFSLTPFEQLRALATSYDVASLCIATITDIVSGLELTVVAKDKKQQAAENSTCDALMAFFAKPDKVNDFSSWLTMLIYDQLVIDALTVYPRKAQGGGLWGLEVVDGATIKPLLDVRGQVAAYQQILWGTPWSNYERADAPNDDDFPEYSPLDLIYKPRWPRSNTPYGYPPTEKIILRVNTALRKQTMDLSRFTDGNVPYGLLSPPEGLMQPEQVAAFEEWFNAALAGNDQARSRIKLMPWAGKYQPLNEMSEGGRYESALDEWMLKVTCAAFAVPPQELGFTNDVNRSQGEMQENALYRRCIIPLCTWLCRTIFNPIIQSPEYLNQPQLEARFDYGEVEDMEKIAAVQQGDVSAGIISASESRSMRYPDLDGNAPGVPVPAQETGAKAGRMLTMADLARPKAALAKAANDEQPPDDEQRRRWEKKLLDWLTDAYTRQGERIREALRDAGETVQAGMIDSIFLSETAAILRDVLPIYDDILSNAAVLAFDQIPIGVDWEQVNFAVLELAQSEATRFAKESTETSKAQTAKIIADWIASGGAMDDLIERVGRVWSGPRADIAAVTEVTRLFAQGNQAAWKASGVVQALQWKTSNDERVCPVCGPLADSELAMDSSNLPPAHPRCRCWIVPVVKKVGEI